MKPAVKVALRIVLHALTYGVSEILIRKQKTTKPTYGDDLNSELNLAGNIGTETTLPKGK